MSGHTRALIASVKDWWKAQEKVDENFTIKAGAAIAGATVLLLGSTVYYLRGNARRADVPIKESSDVGGVCSDGKGRNSSASALDRLERGHGADHPEVDSDGRKSASTAAVDKSSDTEGSPRRLPTAADLSPERRPDRTSKARTESKSRWKSPSSKGKQTSAALRASERWRNAVRSARRLGKRPQASTFSRAERLVPHQPSDYEKILEKKKVRHTSPQKESGTSRSPKKNDSNDPPLLIPFVRKSGSSSPRSTSSRSSSKASTPSSSPRRRPLSSPRSPAEGQLTGYERYLASKMGVSPEKYLRDKIPSPRSPSSSRNSSQASSRASSRQSSRASSPVPLEKSYVGLEGRAEMTSYEAALAKSMGQGGKDRLNRIQQKHRQVATFSPQQRKSVLMSSPSKEYKEAGSVRADYQ